MPKLKKTRKYKKRKCFAVVNPGVSSLSADEGADERADLLLEMKDVKHKIKNCNWKIEDLGRGAEGSIEYIDLHCYLEGLVSQLCEIETALEDL